MHSALDCKKRRAHTAYQNKRRDMMQLVSTCGEQMCVWILSTSNLSGWILSIWILSVCLGLVCLVPVCLDPDCLDPDCLDPVCLDPPGSL